VMADKIENPPAFPFAELNDDGSHYCSHPGMTLRDYFAGQVMAGICAARPPKEYSYAQFVSDSYTLADAMLAARAKVTP